MVASFQKFSRHFRVGSCTLSYVHGIYEFCTSRIEHSAVNLAESIQQGGPVAPSILEVCATSLESGLLVDLLIFLFAADWESYHLKGNSGA